MDSNRVEGFASARVPYTAPNTCGARIDDDTDLATDCGLGLSRRRIRELAAHRELAPIAVADVVHRVIEGDALQVPRDDAAASFVRGLGGRAAWTRGLERLWTQCTALAVSDELHPGAGRRSTLSLLYGQERCALVRAHRLFSLCQVAGVTLDRVLSAGPEEGRAVLDELDDSAVHSVRMEPRSAADETGCASRSARR